MDKIFIEDLKIFANHGVYEFENINGQNFYVNAVIYVDAEKAAINDELELSVDYGSVCKLIKEVMTKNTYKLIEAAAQAIAMEILKQFKLVSSVDIEVRKPEAPIDMEFKSVSVKLHRGWHTAVIALGSNIGDSEGYIKSALEQLEQSEYIKNLKASELIVTKPYGYTDQDDFLNGAVICQTVYSPHALLDFLHKIENNADRTREIHWGPRTLDLDIIFYDDKIIADEILQIPHPDMQNRTFVLEPITQLAPYYRHPVLNLTVSQLLERLKSND